MKSSKSSSPHEAPQASDSLPLDTPPSQGMKLFVGSVPHRVEEQDIFNIFSSYGALNEVFVIRDQATGKHKGAAFVTFIESADAQHAVKELNGKMLFRNSKRPSKVEPAQSRRPTKQRISEEEEEEAPINLVIDGFPKAMSVEDLVEIFSSFGQVLEASFEDEREGNRAFVTMATKEQGHDAIDNMNGKFQLEGCDGPLKVIVVKDQKHTPPRLPQRQSQPHPLAPPAAYPVDPNAQYMMGGGPPHQMYPQQQAQVSAVQMLRQQYPYPQNNSPYMQPQFYPQQMQYDSFRMPQAPPGGSRRSRAEPPKGPTGANLFIYHLPHDITDADLGTLFGHYGNVVSANVNIDLRTGDSRGFGFVSYDSVESAEAAIEALNGFVIGNKRLKVEKKKEDSRNQRTYDGGEALVGSMEGLNLGTHPNASRYQGGA